MVTLCLIKMNCDQTVVNGQKRIDVLGEYLTNPQKSQASVVARTQDSTTFNPYAAGG